MLTILLTMFLTLARGATADGDALLDDAKRAFARDDWPVARQLADAAMHADPALARPAGWLIAMAWELDDQPERALSVYDGLLARWPEHEGARDVAYRKALVLVTLERPAEGLAAARAVGNCRGCPPIDRAKLALVTGTLRVQAGQHRRGARALRSALQAANGEAPWHEAHARRALARLLLREAASVGAEGRGLTLAAAVTRKELLAAARAQLDAAAKLDMPWASLPMLVGLADGWAAYARDLAAAADARPDDAATLREASARSWRDAIALYALAERYGAQASPQHPLLDDVPARREAALAALAAAP